MERIIKTKKFCAEFLNNKDFDRIVRSFERDKFYGLKHISGKAKELKDWLSYPSNPIYASCSSFDDICNVIEDNCEGKLSSDSINTIAIQVTYARDIDPDDSCWDSRIEKNSFLRSIGLGKDDIEKFISTSPTKELSKSDWKLLFLTKSKKISDIYKKAEKGNN
jgi:hypothetical protein